jgi:transposase InsO family protein
MRKEPVYVYELAHVGLDVHAETIAVAVAEPGGEVRPLGSIPNRPEAVAKLVRKLGPREHLRVCYEAGPCGYVLYWQLTKLGVPCDVVAPTLVPTKPGDRVKTDRRDAAKLARCYRAGDLTPVWVPDAAHEALRDLVRAREVAKHDQLRARHRLTKLLLRQGIRPPEGVKPWTQRYRRWLDALPRRRPRRKLRTGARVRPWADRPNAVWTYDLIHDACTDGSRFKCLTVGDEFTKECLAITVARSLPADRVLQGLVQLVARRGAPQYLRSDNGPEFIARRIQRWLAREGITTAYIDPGKPWQNGVGESFHSRFRDECLNQEAFFTVREAAVLIEQFRRTYNEARPHSSLRYDTPTEVATRRARPHREPSPQHGRQAPVAVA